MVGAHLHQHKQWSHTWRAWFHLYSVDAKQNGAHASHIAAALRFASLSVLPARLYSVNAVPHLGITGTAASAAVLLILQCFSSLQPAACHAH
jgi:hypothetical protein